MQAKKTGKRRRGRGQVSNGVSAWKWLLVGFFIGLGFAALLLFKGYLPGMQPRLPSVDVEPAATSDSELVEKDTLKPDSKKKPRYDFFTVLPEMEVVIPDQELSRKAEPSGTGSSSLDSYILQTGSFQNAKDAEQMKAQLALLGSVATIQVVTVNDKTWHRVRIGPFEGARKADEMRRILADNQIETLVMKVNP